MRRHALAALFVSLLIAACTGAPRIPDQVAPSGTAADPAASASPATSADPTGGSDSPRPTAGPPTWQVVDDPRLDGPGELRDVVVGGPGFVAVGGGGDSRGESAAIWTSVDGVGWQGVALETGAATGRLTSVTAGGPGFVAVGGECCPDRATVWTSEDGLDWQKVEEQESLEGAVMTSVAAWAGGLVAVGCVVDLECAGTAIWSSTDGFAWERVALTSETRASHLRDVTASGSVLVAVGTTDGNHPGPPAIFVSLDAQAWTRADVPTVPISLTSVTVGPAGIVAVGTSLDEVSGLPGSLVLTSPDGASWDATSSDTFARALAEDIVVGPDGFVMAGRLKRGKGGIAAAWHSADGRSWVRVAPGPEGVIRAVIATEDGRLVAVGGRTEDGGTSRPGVWLSPGDDP